MNIFLLTSIMCCDIAPKYLILAILIGYALGCFQTSFFIGKAFKHIDIRDYGSGNAGTTNAFRVMGSKAGITTFLGDFIKGLVGFLIGFHFLNSLSLAFVTGFFVIIGHNWPVILKFKGGKGIASTVGIIFAYNWKLGILVFLIAFAIGYISKYVSLASLTLTFLFPLALLILKEDIAYIIIATLLFIIAVYRHRANISRLKNGTESKVKLGG